MSRQTGQDVPAEALGPAATVEVPVAPAAAVADTEVVDVEVSPMLAVPAIDDEDPAALVDDDDDEVEIPSTIKVDVDDDP